MVARGSVDDHVHERVAVVPIKGPNLHLPWLMLPETLVAVRHLERVLLDGPGLRIVLDTPDLPNGLQAEPRLDNPSPAELHRRRRERGTVPVPRVYPHLLRREPPLQLVRFEDLVQLISDEDLLGV